MGEVVKIGDEVDSVTIDTSGGRLSSLVMARRERLLVAPAVGADPVTGWGCLLMAPFVGRIYQGMVDWGGRKTRLRLNGDRHSINGAVFDDEWEVDQRTGASVAISCRLDPNKWPFRGIVRQRVAMARGLMRLEAEIEAIDQMPAALGWLPWFRHPGSHVCLSIQSEDVLELTPDLIPTGELAPVDRRTDLRTGPSLVGHHLDDVYVAVKSPVVISWPDIDFTMSMARSVGTVAVFTHPQAICVQPMTAWPDAIRLAGAGREDTGLALLAPGEKLKAAVSCAWTARHAPPVLGPLARRARPKS
jgi:aldose 1-epimerase